MSYSHRLRYYNYASPTTWFITINTHNRIPYFGQIQNGQMELNEFGRIAAEEWQKSAQLRKHISLGEFVIMPDHFHALLTFLPLPHELPQPRWHPYYELRPQLEARGPKPKSLGAVVAGFKAAVTSRINQTRQTTYPPVWQKNYHDRAVKDALAHQHITRYIRENPANFRPSVQP
ncbi:MAG: transposase [Bacteroidia bacterium]|jgi:REP element-mobilizing transposase RayT|nr:transposase [Bacteroidia bacterium]